MCSFQASPLGPRNVNTRTVNNSLMSGPKVDSYRPKRQNGLGTRKWGDGRWSLRLIAAWPEEAKCRTHRQVS